MQPDSYLKLSDYIMDQPPALNSKLKGTLYKFWPFLEKKTEDREMRIKPKAPIGGHEEEKKDPVPVQNEPAQGIDVGMAELMLTLGMQQNQFTWEKEIAADADVNGTFEQQMAKFDRHIRKYTFGNGHYQNVDNQWGAPVFGRINMPVRPPVFAG